MRMFSTDILFYFAELPPSKKMKVKDTTVEVLNMVNFNFLYKKQLICTIIQVDKEMHLFGGIQNKDNSCWLSSIIQLMNTTNIYQFICGV